MIESLYRTRTPHASTWREEFFELSIGEQAVDGQLGYFVRETQCWWDVTAKRTVRVQYTLSPREGFLTMEEARRRYHQQRMSRALRGFIHSFTPCYDTASKHKYLRIEMISDSAQRERQDASNIERTQL